MKSIGEPMLRLATAHSSTDLRFILPAHAVLSALPQLGGDFERFNRSLPIADSSMQRMYSTLQGLVQPLDQPDDPQQGVFLTMGPEQLRWRGLEEQWAAQMRI
jgi:hypothetical protein